MQAGNAMALRPPALVQKNTAVFTDKIMASKKTRAGFAFEKNWKQKQKATHVKQEKEFGGGFRRLLFSDFQFFLFVD